MYNIFISNYMTINSELRLFNFRLLLEQIYN